jgi:ketosteroid isomerase-like protein
MNSDERRQAIELEIRNFGAAAARKDYLGVAGFFTEDAKVLPPGAPIVSGRKAIGEFWRAALERSDLAFKTTELEVAGDTAYEIGETDTGQAKAKYLVVWLRCPDGRWRLHRDIWNNMPTS